MHHLLAEQEICVRFTFSLLVQGETLLSVTQWEKSEERIRYQNKQWCELFSLFIQIDQQI